MCFRKEFLRCFQNTLVLHHWLCGTLWLCESQQSVKILLRWGYQTTLPLSCETCNNPELFKQLEPDMEQQTGSKVEKEYIRAIHCHPAYLTFIKSTSTEMWGWMDHNLESRLPGEISTTSDMQMTPPPLWQKAKRNLRDSWWGERVEWKSWLKTQHEETKIRVSGPITSWQRDGGKVEAVADAIFLDSKITVDGDSSHEIKRH